MRNLFCQFIRDALYYLIPTITDPYVMERDRRIVLNTATGKYKIILQIYSCKYFIGNSYKVEVTTNFATKEKAIEAYDRIYERSKTYFDRKEERAREEQEIAEYKERQLTIQAENKEINDYVNFIVNVEEQFV